MSPRSLFGIGASLAVVFTIVTTNLWRELSAERERNTALRNELVEAKERYRDFVIGTPPVQGANTRTIAPGVQEPASPAPGVIAESRTSSSSATPHGELEVPEDTGSREARLAALRTAIGQTHPAVPEELGLTPEEAAELFSLLAEAQLSMGSLPVKALTGDRQADDAAIDEMQRAQTVVMRRRGDAIRALLGEARYKQWQEYQHTRPQRLRVSSYAAAMRRVGEPLNDNQTRALVDVVIHEENDLQQDIVTLARSYDSTIPQAQAVARQDLKNRRTESRQRLLGAASAVLNSRQLQVLRIQLEQQETIEQAQEAIRKRADASQSRQ